MPESGKDTKRIPKRAALAAALLAAFLLVLAAGLLPQVSGDHRDIVALGKLDASNSGAVVSSSSHASRTGPSSRSDSAGVSAPTPSEPPSSSDDADSTAAEPLQETEGAASDVHDEQVVPSGSDSEGLTYAVDNPVDFNAQIESVMQFPDVPGGCEVASMTSVLRSMGFDIGAYDLANEYLITQPGEHDMVHGFSGSPFGQGAAFPPIMTRAGNAYLRYQESEWRFVERKGALLSRLICVVESGRPVLVWTTMGLEPAQHTDLRIEGYEWYSNEHCVVLYGVSEEGNLKTMDPLEGLIERDPSRFEEIYYDCGALSITLSRVATAEIDELELELANTLSVVDEASQEQAEEGGDVDGTEDGAA